MKTIISHSPAETEQVGRDLAASLTGGRVVALFGDLGMGKTAFVRGMATGRGLSAEVSSPTFALVHDYGGQPPLVHFDMYRIEGALDLESTGFYDYPLDEGVFAIEWSENIASELPENCIRITIERLSDDGRQITVEGDERFADLGD